MPKNRQAEAITDIAQLRPDPKNARRHGDRNLGMIQDALREIGAARSIVIDEAGTILAGNGVVQAAPAAGIHRVRVIDADADTLVAVRRTGLSPEQKSRLALWDNRAAELATWDSVVLAALRDESPAALEGLFTDDELDDLLRDLARSRAGPDPGPQLDRAAELLAKWQCRTGDLWEVPSLVVRAGAHRIAVGDSTDPAVVALALGDRKAEMVWTDPPYAVDMAEKNRHLNRHDKASRTDRPMQGDAISAEGLTALLNAAFPAALAACKPGAPWYVASPHGHLVMLRALTELRIWRQTLVWAKNYHVLGRSDYHYQHEAILYGWAPGAQRPWHGGRTLTSLLANPRPVEDLSLAELQELASAVYEDSDIIHVDKPQASALHPTTKPVELIARNLRASSRPGALVLDPFAGSGSTAVACEQEARLAALVEIEPAYAACILERLAGMGLSPARCDRG